MNKHVLNNAGELRKRRNIYAISVVLFVVSWFVAASNFESSSYYQQIVLVAGIVVVALQWPLFYAKCTGCKKAFFISGIVINPFSNKCVHCGSK